MFRLGPVVSSRLVGWSLVAALAFIVLVVAARPAWASEDHFRVERLDANIHVNADGSSVIDATEVTSLLTETGIDWYSEEKVAFSSSRETAEVLNAFTELPDGQQIPVDPKAIRLVEDDAAGQVGGYSDAKAYAVIFPQVSKGVRTHLQTRVEEHTPLFAGHFTFTWQLNRAVFYGDVTIDLSHDPAIDLMIEASETDPGAQVTRLPMTEDKLVRYRITFSNRSPIALDSATVEGLDIHPYLRISSIPDMLTTGLHYQEMAQSAEAVTPAVQALADQITAGLSDRRAQARAIYEWVTTEIRYVAIFLGDGGVVPNLAKDIIRNRYGDCKDHNTLLIALLTAKGIKAESALINSGYTYQLPKLGDVSPLNHVITYLPEWDLYVDSTDRYAPFGVLPSSVADKPTILTKSLAYGRTPKTQALANRVESKVTMRIDDNGQIVGEGQIERRGPSAIWARDYLSDYQGRYRDEMIVDQLREFGHVGFGTYESQTIGDDTLRDPVQIDTQFEIEPVTNFPGPGAMMVPVGLAPGRIASFGWTEPHPEHAWPFVCDSYSYAEQTTLAFPDTVSVTRTPPDTWFASGGMVYRASYRQEGQAVIIEREMMVDRRSAVCQPGEETSFNDMLSVIQHDLRGQIFYQ